MMYSSTTQTRTTTTTASRVETVLTEFLGDLAAFISNGHLTKERALDWLKDLCDILMLEAVKSFQVKVTPPGGPERALDYEISDDGTIRSSDGSGGFSAQWIPAGTSLSLVVCWKEGHPNVAAGRELLRARGWGPGSRLETSGAAGRVLSKDNYGFYRRTVGEWPL